MRALISLVTGSRVRKDVLGQRRAEYGGEVIAELGRRLEREYGRGFGEKSLRHMLRFAEQFPDKAIVSALGRQLSFTHFRLLSLSWLNRHERKAGEGAPVALILCAGKNRATVEYLELDKDNIHVAEYLTQLPPRRVRVGCATQLGRTWPVGNNLDLSVGCGLSAYRA